jgi:hypothetical protein
MTITLQEPVKLTKPGLQSDFWKMFEESLFTDFELKFNDGGSLLCHKSILVSRSPVFNAMITNDMTESRQGFAEITDFDFNIMRQILRFIYCGEVESMDKIARDLIFAAEKYQLDELKEMCKENILMNLSDINVVEVLQIADKIPDCESLFEKAVRFVGK